MLRFLKRHTVAQVIAGAAIGILLTALQFQLLFTDVT
jgi:acid phosphatase family membrane protein YuiD